MNELLIKESVTKNLNLSLGNNFINKLISDFNIGKFWDLFDNDICLTDNAFSQDCCLKVDGKEKVQEYFGILFIKYPEIFRIKSRDLNVVKLANEKYNILIVLKGLSVINNKNSIFKIKLETNCNNNNCYVIKAITFSPIESVDNKSNRMNGGVISFSLNNSFSIDFISEELLIFLKYSHKGKFLSDCDGKLSSALRIGDKNSLNKAISDSIIAKTYFKTKVRLRNGLAHYIDVNIVGQTLMFEDSKYKVFAIISEDSFNLQFKTFLENISSQLINITQSYHNPIFWKDYQGNFLGCNVAFLEQFHINSAKDILYHDDSIIFNKEIAAKHLEEDQLFLSGKESQYTLTESVVVDEKTIYLKVKKVPLYRLFGVIGILGIVLDVTVAEEFKKIIVQKDTEINYLFAISSHGYFIKDHNLKFVKVNKIFSDIVNIPMDKIIGKTNEELLINGYDARESEQEILITKEKVSFIYTKAVNKSTKYFVVTEKPQFDDEEELLKIIGSVIDVTEIINNRKKLTKDYHHDTSVLNGKCIVSITTIDMTTRIITSYAQKGSNLNIVGSLYTENMVKNNASQFLYKIEECDFIDTFSFDSLIMINKTHSNVKRIYTIKKCDNTLINVLFTVDFNINPFSSHIEASIKSIDVTESQLSREVVNSFDMQEYDFIVRLSTLIDTFVILYSDKSQYDFSENDDDNNVDKFLDVLFKNSISKRPKTIKWVNDLTKCFKTHAEWNFDIDTKNGSRKNIIVRPLNAEKQLVIIVSQDITKRTKHDRDIKLKLEKLAAEAVTGNNIKTDFIARMSHDMRTPLAAIIGLTDFGISESKDEDLTSYFEKIRSSSEYLITLLNDVLDMQVIEKGNLVLNPTNTIMLEKINNIKTIILPRAIEKNINLTINRKNIGPNYISIDSQRAEQVIVNVLTNAVKYTSHNGNINWVIEFFDGDLPFIRHIISDDGVGMSNDFQKHMFDSFSREDNVFSSAEGGSGIGLAIVKNIIKVMGGNIKCESELGKGTTFELDIPVIPISKEKYERDLNKNKCFNPKVLMNRKILVCEDNLINVLIIKKILSKYKMTIDIASNGERGVELAFNNDYDAILMDIRMPIMNGLDAAKAIRKKDKIIPIIAVSANAYKTDIEKSFSCGMNAHILKPINKDELFCTLADLIKNK